MQKRESKVEIQQSDSKSEKPIRTFTTGQVSGITQVGRQSLYRYVKEFGEFFSKTATQHKQGRRWTQMDIETIHAIRCLYHDHTGTEAIREMIKGGWKLTDNEAWSRELQSRLIEMVIEANTNAEIISRQAINAINDLQSKTDVVEANQKVFADLWLQVQDLKAEWEALEGELLIKGRMSKKYKPRYRQKPPQLFLMPVSGKLSEFKVVDDDKESE